MADVIQYKYKKFSKIVRTLCEHGKIPLYFHIKANKTYNNYQHLFLLIAKEHTTYGYRKFTESLYDSKIPQYIGLKRIPHFTTLQKYSSRIKARILNKLVFLTSGLFKERGHIIGADSTGMELDHASAHYCKRIDRDKPIKGFVNLNMICDIPNRTFLTTKIRKRRRSDCIDFRCMFNKIKYLDFDYVVADKGYDAQYNHKAVYEAGADSQIKVKDYRRFSHRAGQRFRKKALKEHNPAIYGQRALCESIFSSLKRKYGAKLRARKYQTQKVELLFKIISYNIEQFTRNIIEILRLRLRFLQSPSMAVG